jgi:predicted DNA repair protein MutK
MATAGLLALLDDIATLLDDVSLLTKVAAQKTAGVVGDDLALNANQLIGIASKREIPVVLAVAKGSMINKVILVPAALAISVFAPWAITPLLMMGGTYLCFEGVEKIFHKHSGHAHPALETVIDPVAHEKEKIKGAIRTDFILSAEIVVIALGTAADADLATRVGVLCAVAVAMTVGVYGLVAAIVKLDDFGLYLTTQKNAFTQWLGKRILDAAPILLKTISVVGTAAMFLVGGGIMVHGLPVLEHALHDILPHGFAGDLISFVTTGAFGILVGFAALGVVKIVQKIVKRFKPSKQPSH